MSSTIIKAILYIGAALVALAAIITAVLYDWGNKDIDEYGRGADPAIKKDSNTPNKA